MRNKGNTKTEQDNCILTLETGTPVSLTQVLPKEERFNSINTYWAIICNKLYYLKVAHKKNIWLALSQDQICEGIQYSQNFINWNTGSLTCNNLTGPVLRKTEETQYSGDRTWYKILYKVQTHGIIRIHNPSSFYRDYK